MYNFLIKLIVMSIISTNLFAQPVYFQPPKTTNSTTTTSSLPPPSILSPDQFKNKVNNLDQQNQAARTSHLEQLSNALPQPLAPPAPKETATNKTQPTTIAPKAPDAQPIQPPPAAAPTPASQAPTEPAQPQAQPYTPSFQSGSPPASGGGNWNIKY